MLIRERTRYPLSAEEIWPWIVQPDMLVQWNPSIRKVHTQNAFAVGQEFWTEYVLREALTTCSSRVVTLDAPVRLELEHERCHTASGPSALRVRERFDLVRRGVETELRHSVRIKGHGLSVGVVVLLWFLHTVGRTADEDRLGALLARQVKSKLGETLK